MGGAVDILNLDGEQVYFKRAMQHPTGIDDASGLPTFEPIDTSFVHLPSIVRSEEKVHEHFVERRGNRSLRERIKRKQMQTLLLLPKGQLQLRQRWGAR